MSLGSLALSEAQKFFQKFLKKAEREIGRKVKPPLPILRLSDTAPDLGRPDLGVVSGLGELVIPSCEPWLMKGILAVEAFKLLLPASIVGLTQAADLAFAFSFQQLDSKGRERWQKLWREAAGVGEKVDLEDLYYDSIAALVLLYYLKEGKGLGKLVNHFADLDRFHIRLGTEAFIHQVVDFISQCKAPLTLREIRVIDLMLREANISAEELAQRSSLTVQMVSSVQASLKRRGILYIQPAVNLPRLGYRTHILYLTPEPSAEMELLEQLRGYKHLTSLIQFNDGLGGLIAVITLTDGAAERADMKRLKQALKAHCLPDQLLSFRRTRRFHFINFRSYLVKEGRWRVKWRAWSLWLKRLLDEGLPKILPSREIVVKAQKAPTLDSTDQAILTEISRGEWRLRQLREKLRIGSNVLAAKMKRLRKEKLVQDEVVLRHIGLEETAYLFFYVSTEETDLLVAGLNELPYHVSAELEGDKRGLFTSLYLPQGNASMMAGHLRQQLPNIPLEIRFGTQIPLSQRHFPPYEFLG
ncbi:MAG: hypothetical protein ACFFCO_11570 [Promethearchaeota archaeon]